MPDPLWPHGLQPTRLLCPWDFPGKDTGMVCYFLLQGRCSEATWNLWSHGEMREHRLAWAKKSWMWRSASILTLPSYSHGRRDMFCGSGLQTWGIRAILKMNEAFLLLLCPPLGKSLRAPELSFRPQHRRMGPWVWSWAARCWHWFLAQGPADPLSGTTPLCAVGWPSFSRAATANHHNWMASNNNNVCAHSSGGRKSKTRVLTGSRSFWRFW